MRSTFRRTAIATAVTATAGVFLLAGTASAHIDPSPPAVQAGTSATVAFGVEHGCEGSPTVELQIQVPDGVTDAQPVDKDGWTASSATGDDGVVVTFADGSLDPETPDDFSISFTAPTEAGTILFPIVQICEAGQLDWIEVAVEGEEEPEHPAPAVTVTAEAPTAEELAPEVDEDTGVVDEETQHEMEEMDSTTIAADTVPTSTTDPVGSAGEAIVAASDDGDGSNTALIIGAIVVGVVVIFGAGYLVMRRAGASDSSDGGTTSENSTDSND